MPGDTLWLYVATVASVIAAVILLLPLIGNLLRKLYLGVADRSPPALLTATLLAFMLALLTNATPAWTLAGNGLGAIVALYWIRGRNEET